MVFLCLCGGLIWENRVHNCGQIRCSCGGMIFDGRGHCCGYTPNYSQPPTGYELWRGFRCFDEWTGSRNWGKLSPNLFNTNTRNQGKQILNTTTSMQEIKSLRQTGSFHDYCNSFDSLLNEVILSEDYAIKLFIEGLKMEISGWVRWLRPQTLEEAYEKAKNQANFLDILDRNKTVVESENSMEIQGPVDESENGNEEFNEFEIHVIDESENSEKIQNTMSKSCSENAIQETTGYEVLEVQGLLSGNNSKKDDMIIVTNKNGTHDQDINKFKNEISSLTQDWSAKSIMAGHRFTVYKIIIKWLKWLLWRAYFVKIQCATKGKYGNYYNRLTITSTELVLGIFVDTFEWEPGWKVHYSQHYLNKDIWFQVLFSFSNLFGFQVPKLDWSGFDLFWRGLWLTSFKQMLIEGAAIKTIDADFDRMLQVKRVSNYAIVLMVHYWVGSRICSLVRRLIRNSLLEKILMEDGDKMLIFLEDGAKLLTFLKVNLREANEVTIQFGTSQVGNPKSVVFCLFQILKRDLVQQATYSRNLWKLGMIGWYKSRGNSHAFVNSQLIIRVDMGGRFSCIFVELCIIKVDMGGRFGCIFVELGTGSDSDSSKISGTQSNQLGCLMSKGIQINITFWEQFKSALVIVRLLRTKVFEGGWQISIRKWGLLGLFIRGRGKEVFKVNCSLLCVNIVPKFFYFVFDSFD